MRLTRVVDQPGWGAFAASITPACMGDVTSSMSGYPAVSVVSCRRTRVR